MSWIHFTLVDLRDGRKTKVWAVMTADGKVCLGRIAWYSPWRKFCFVPSEETVFEEDCLTEIAEFCANATAERKRERAA